MPWIERKNTYAYDGRGQWVRITHESSDGASGKTEAADMSAVEGPIVVRSGWCADGWEDDLAEHGWQQESVYNAMDPDWSASRWLKAPKEQDTRQISELAREEILDALRRELNGIVLVSDVTFRVGTNDQSGEKLSRRYNKCATFGLPRIDKGLDVIVFRNDNGSDERVLVVEDGLDYVTIRYWQNIEYNPFTFRTSVNQYAAAIAAANVLEYLQQAELARHGKPYNIYHYDFEPEESISG